MDDLIESILDYIRSDYTDYAIMINGEWGSGKTYFWNNQIKKKIDNNIIKNIAVSYVTMNGGLKPVLLYRLIMDMYLIVAPIKPELGEYLTSVIGILVSVFITMYYIGKISKKIGVLFVAIIAVGGLAVGYIASQSIATQTWTLNPVELIFYRAAFTQEVFEKIIPLAGTTHGHILSMIFSSGSPRSFIGNYVLHYDVCLTSTMFGPVMLDFGYIGLTIQMLFMGAFLKIIHSFAKKGVGIGIYSIILTHTLIWIETGPTDIMIWFLYLLGAILIILEFKKE